jgi:hypothetical protein
METFNNIWPVNDLQVYGTSTGMKLFLISLSTSNLFPSFIFYLLLKGMWPCGSFQRYSDMIVVESVLGMQVPTTQYFDNVAFVRLFPLFLCTFFTNFPLLPLKVDVAKTPTGPSLSNAINLYDSGWIIDGALFQGYNVNQSHSIFRETGIYFTKIKLKLNPSRCCSV